MRKSAAAVALPLARYPLSKSCVLGRVPRNRGCSPDVNKPRAPVKKCSIWLKDLPPLSAFDAPLTRPAQLNLIHFSGSKTLRHDASSVSPAPGRWRRSAMLKKAG